MNVTNIIDRIDNFKLRFKPNESHLHKIRTDDARMDESRVESQEPPKEDILKTLDKLNSSMENINEKVKFTFHEQHNRVIIKVVNTETEEVVREIPSRDIVKLSEHLQEYIGMLIDESR